MPARVGRGVPVTGTAVGSGELKLPGVTLTGVLDGSQMMVGVLVCVGVGVGVGVGLNVAAAK